jgi:hypothetical protein
MARARQSAAVHPAPTATMTGRKSEAIAALTAASVPIVSAPVAARAHRDHRSPARKAVAAVDAVRTPRPSAKPP